MNCQLQRHIIFSFLAFSVADNVYGRNASAKSTFFAVQLCIFVTF